MTKWFAGLPIHRKLVVMALAVSGVAVAATVAGLLAFDIARFRSTATDDARAFAEVIASTSAAAIVFDDPQAARQILDSVQVRPLMSRACLYRADGTLFAGYERAAGAPAARCPRSPSTTHGWRAVTAEVSVTRAGRRVGSVFVERLLTDLPGRIIVTTAVAGLMLVLAAALAFGLAQRIQQVISRPIVALAHAASAVGMNRYEIPAIAASPDETGALVKAFSDMIHRLANSNAEREELLARERDASRLKDEFLAAVSHELRTPLNAILGWAQILERTHPDEGTIAKAIAGMSRNARAQSRVIEDLLDISRMISGKLQLTLSPIDLGVALESAVEVIAPMADAKRVHIHVTVLEDPSLIQGDFDRIRQVFWNLLSNAVKFTPAGGRVDATIAEVQEGYAVSIADSGIGIAPSFVPYVFDRFRQADGSTTREHGGLGLGLAIAKELIERHNGSITVSSGGLGHGSTFVVTVPRLIGSSSDDRRTALAPLALNRLDGVTLVVVDDSEDALEIVATTLSRLGAHVRTFVSPNHALAEIERDRPDIVLCDLAMPRMDGFAVLKQIRELDAGRERYLPVIAVTAYTSDDYRDRCRRAGFQGHVPKPYDPAQLVRSITIALSGMSAPN